MHDQLIHDLTRRRRELTCEINDLLDRIDRLTDDVETIDRVMLMFRPDMKPDAIPALHHRAKPDWAKRGQVTRHIFAALLKAEAPMTLAEVTSYVMTARGIDDPALVPKHRKRVYKALDQQRQKGNLSAEQVGRLLRWQLTGKTGEPAGGWRNGATPPLLPAR